MKLTTLTILGLALSLNALAGDKGGNGGIVVKCGDKIQLAEYYEAENLPGFKGKINMLNSQKDVDTLVLEAIRRVNALQPSTIDVKEYENLKSKINWTAGDFKWNFTDDLGPFYKSQECETLNVINYFEDDFVEGDLNLYDRLTKSEKAALFMHEIIYKMTRTHTGQKTSLPARRIITALFAQNVDSEILKGLLLKYLLAPKQVTLENNTTSLTLNFSRDYVGVHIEAVRRNNPSIKVEQLVKGKGIFKTLQPKYLLENISSNKVYLLEIFEWHNKYDDTYRGATYTLTMNPNNSNPIKMDFDSSDILKGNSSSLTRITRSLLFLPKFVSEFVRGRL